MSDQVRVQFGSGGNILADFTNHDAEVDISRPLPYADSSVDFILAEHVVEHINSHDAMRFFMEAARILKPYCSMRVCVPILDRLVENGDYAHARDLVFGHGHQMVYSHNSLRSMLIASGFGAVMETGRYPIDGHWRVIGKEKDDLETLRMHAIK